MKWILAALILLGGSGVWAQSATQEEGAAAKKQEAPKPQRIRIGGNVQSAKVLERTEPIYPPLARTARISGTVKLQIIVGTDGAVKEVYVISGHPLLVQAAIDAVRKWKYKPMTLDGMAVEVDTTVDVVFSLGEGGGATAPSLQLYGFVPGMTGGGLEPRPLTPEMKDALEHMFEAMHYKEMMAETGRTMFESLRPMFLGAMPVTPNREKIVNALAEKLLATLQTDEAQQQNMEVYARHFSVEDIKRITQFYETPAGQHYVKAVAQVFAESARAGQIATMKNMSRILKELCDEYPELGGKLPGCAAKEPEKRSQFLPPERPALGGTASGAAAR